MLVDLASYVASPFGKTCGTAQIFAWFPTPELRVIAAWGNVTEADADFIARAAARELDPALAPHSSLIDLRGLLPLSRGTIDRFFDAGFPNLAKWQAALVSSAIVHDGGVGLMAAGAVAGYTAHSPHPLDVHLHTTVAEALARLPVAVDAAAIEAGIDLRRRYLAEQHAFIAELRAWLVDHHADATMGSCARALGLAPRTLQRRLLDADSTFRRELRRARIERAKHLLVLGELKIAAVAFEVGYPNLQNLAAAFRSETGLTPSGWREQNVGARRLACA